MVFDFCSLPAFQVGRSWAGEGALTPGAFYVAVSITGGGGSLLPQVNSGRSPGWFLCPVRGRCPSAEMCPEPPSLRPL